MAGATTAPSTKLEIKSSGSDDGIQIIKSDNTNILGSLIQTGSGDGALTLRNAGNSQTVLFRGQGNNYITGGNFGLGTSSPDATLRIDNESGTALKVTGGAGGTSIASFVRDVGANVSINVHGDSARPQISLASAANTFSMGVIGSSFEIADSDALGSNTRLSIDSSGRLGLGTSSPTAPLHIATSGTGDTLLLESTDAGTGNAPILTLWRNSS